MKAAYASLPDRSGSAGPDASVVAIDAAGRGCLLPQPCSHEPGRLTTVLITDWPSFFSLEAEWDELLAHSRADAIFLTWDWIRCWIEVAGHNVRPFVITVRDAKGMLVGVAAFYMSELRLLRTLPFRTLRVMADYATGAEYPDLIVHRDCEEAAVDAIAAALGSRCSDWDCIWMPVVSGWTGAAERLRRVCENQGFYCHSRFTNFGYFDLPESWDAYVRSLSQNRKQQMRSDKKRVMQRPGVSIARCETRDQIPAFLDALFDLHHRRWKEQGEEGTFRKKPSEAAFYRSFAPRALRNGWLRLAGVQENGEFKAVQIGYVYRGIFLQMQEGFDPAYVRGAGNVLRASTIEATIAEGVKGYDFLGEMTEHKRRWMAQQRDGWDFFIGNRSLKNTALFYKEIWPTGRYLRPVWGGNGLALAKVNEDTQ